MVTAAELLIGRLVGGDDPRTEVLPTAFGPDRPGIVRRFSQFLAGKDINIVDLYGELLHVWDIHSANKYERRSTTLR